MSFLSDITLAFENNSQVDTIYLDFKKAFDRVPHLELLNKLNHIGISGTLWKWFEEYLTSRRQLVSINGTQSSLLPVSSGVPQGSILGPLLFLVYINDLPDCVSSAKTYLFADDTKCSQLISSPSDVNLLQADLDRLYQWSVKWSLSFNEQKCIVLQFRKDPSAILSLDQPYTLDDKPILVKECHRDLGLLIQQSLNWSKHYNHITAKAYAVLSQLKRTFSPSNSQFTKKRLYLALVHSQITYCSQLWRPMLMGDIIALERTQRRASKFVVGSISTSLNYKARLILLHILPLMYYLELADIMFFVNSYKCQSNRFNILNYVTISNKNTRSSNKITLCHVRSSTSKSRHFYFNRLPRLWNRLPAIDITLSSRSIRASLREFLWSHFLSSFESDKPCTYHFLCPCGKCSAIPVHIC